MTDYIWEKRRKRRKISPTRTLQQASSSYRDTGLILEQKPGWIKRKRGERERMTGDPTGRDNLFLFQGRWYPITQGFACTVTDDLVTYTTPAELKVMLSTLLRAEAEEQIRRHTPALGCSVKSICIRTQRSRWGSCSGEGTLNFNLALMALPLPLRTYILLHEMVHLVERNHRPKFWERLETLCPEYRMHRNELKKYGDIIERNTIWRVLRDG